MKVYTTMANARPGFKRVAGEIPEAMHEKITLFNKITDRPFNVSKAIELCMRDIVDRIDANLVNGIYENGCDRGVLSDEIYEAIKKDIEDVELGPAAIHIHFIEMFKNKGSLNDADIKKILYPIDEIKYEKLCNSDTYKTIFFCAMGNECFALAPRYPFNEKDNPLSNSSEEV